MTEYPQESPQGPYPPGAPPPPSAKKEGIGKYILLAGVGCLLLLGLIGAIVFLVFKFTAGPVDVVNKSLAALREGKVEEAYAMCSKEFQRSASLDDFRNYVERYSILKNAKEFSSYNREVSNGVATLNGNIKGKDDSTVPAVYKLVKEGGGWKILYMNITAGPDVTQERQVTETPRAQQPQPTQENAPIGDQPAQQTPQEINQPAGISGYRITDLKLDKQTSGDLVTVKIDFQVLGFANDKSSGSARIHLIEDLETLDPQGNVVADLTKPGIKELAESGAYEEYTNANFTNTLTIPTSYPSGKYTAKITVHDRVAEKSTNTSVDFEIP